MRASEHSGMEQLESRVLDYINLVESEEFKKADRLVKIHAAALDYIKSEFKKQGKPSITVKDGKESKKLAFTVRTQLRVDVKALPMEIREEYMTDMEVWIKNVEVWENE
ncbi:hypothetical protein DFS34DRAFT_691111 [Phlyctochytrium arcticum]|nr:hypothetical protein DFS34DRAFT_691111 [Phlyctochytrium arcticum]